MKIVFPQLLTNALVRSAARRPFHTLDGYMKRDWLLDPKSILARVTGCGARIQQILSSDREKVPHDHPWPYISFILKGGYTEVRHHDTLIAAHRYAIKHRAEHGMPEVHFNGAIGRWESYSYYGAGSVLFRKAKTMHRLVIAKGESATTLFIMGRYRQKWGYLTAAGKVYWRDYQCPEEVARAAAAIEEVYGVQA